MAKNLNECRPEHKMSRTLQPFLLLLLYEKSSYGYNLIKRLGNLGIQDIHLDPGAVYKNLRQMQGDGVVESAWKVKSAGAPTRIYKITAEGEKILHQWVVVIEKRHSVIGKFLNNYYKLFKKTKK